MSNVDIEKNEREGMRWRILVTTHIGGPWPVSEGTLQMALEDSHLRITVAQLRKELKYLESKNLIVLHAGDVPVWGVQLTALGTDVVEHTAPCPDGIRRSAKWY